MADDDVLDLARQGVARLNAGDVSGFTELLSREFYDHAPAADAPGAPEVIGALLTDLRAALPDLAIELTHATPAATGAQATVLLTGTQSGELWGVPALGKRHEHELSISLRIRDDGLAFNLELEPPGRVGLARAFELVNPPDEMHLPNRHPVAFPDMVLRLVFTGQVADKPCSHIDTIKITRASTDECKDCVGSGDIWPALRMCLVCGYTGCCDTSVNTHVKKHADATGHVIVRSIRDDEGWVWCYECLAFRDKPWLERLEATIGAT